MAHLKLTIFGDRVVQGHDGRNHALDLQYVASKTLVVVHEMKIKLTFFQHTSHTHAEGQRFTELASEKLCSLDDVGPGLKLPVGR